MDFKNIKLLPATNAVGQVYAEATGMPIVGEMMAAAAGQGGSPEPEPDDFRITVKVVKEDEYTCYLAVTSNVQAPVDNASIYIIDVPTMVGCDSYDYSCGFEGHFIPSSADPLVWVSEDYWCDIPSIQMEVTEGCGCTYVAQADWIEGSVYDEYAEQTYEHAISGTWTFEDQTI